MERCTLTQRPCRKAIEEIVKANKNRYFLQRTCETARILLEGSKAESRMKMSQEDGDKFFLIWNILESDNADDIKRLLNLSNYLLFKKHKEDTAATEE